MRPSPCTPTRADVGQQHHRHLPDVAVQAGAGQLLAGDGVGLAQDVEPLAGDLADDPDAQARPGERLAPDDLGRQPELLADQPHLVLEQRAQRLDQLELQVVGQPADVVVGLDVGGAGAAAGLDHVGVERALHQERHRGPGLPAAAPSTSASAASKTRMNSRPMILRFSSGSLTPASASRKRFCASTTWSLTPVAATKSRSTCSASPLRSSPWSTKTQVSRSPIARCTMAAATAESTPPDSPQMARPVSPIWARIRLDLLLDDVDHRPGLAAAGDVVQEVLEHLLAVLGVQHLGVPLHAGQPAVEVLERRDRGGRRWTGQHGEPVRARPPPSRRGTSTPCARSGTSASSVPGVATLTGVRPYSRAPVWATSPPSAARHQLEAVAHAEDRHAGARRRAGSTRGRAVLVHRRRARRTGRSPWARARASRRPASVCGTISE